MNASQPSAAGTAGGLSSLSSYSDDMAISELTGTEFGRQLRSQGKLVALHEGDDDGRIPMPQVRERAQGREGGGGKGRVAGGGG